MAHMLQDASRCLKQRIYAPHKLRPSMKFIDYSVLVDLSPGGPGWTAQDRECDSAGKFIAAFPGCAVPPRPTQHISFKLPKSSMPQRSLPLLRSRPCIGRFSFD
jgi:hypothetical protein